MPAAAAVFPQAAAQGLPWLPPGCLAALTGGGLGVAAHIAAEHAAAFIQVRMQGVAKVIADVLGEVTSRCKPANFWPPPAAEAEAPRAAQQKAPASRGGGGRGAASGSSTAAAARRGGAGGGAAAGGRGAPQAPPGMPPPSRLPAALAVGALEMRVAALRALIARGGGEGSDARLRGQVDDCRQQLVATLLPAAWLAAEPAQLLEAFDCSGGSGGSGGDEEEADESGGSAAAAALLEEALAGALAGKVRLLPAHKTADSDAATAVCAAAAAAGLNPHFTLSHALLLALSVPSLPPGALPRLAATAVPAPPGCGLAALRAVPPSQLLASLAARQLPRSAAAANALLTAAWWAIYAAAIPPGAPNASGVAPGGPRPQPHFNAAWWMAAAADAIFKIGDWESLRGYPGPPLLLDLLERSALLCLALAKRLHNVVAPRRLALHALGPQGPLLSWLLAENINQAQKWQLQVRRWRGLCLPTYIV